MDLSIYKIDLDTDQPNGGKGESPRSAFTKYNNSLDTINSELTTLGDSAMKKADNLSDLTDASTARNNLGLGNAAIRNVGTDSGNVMEVGDVIKAITPIGMVYTQYPDTETPSSLFGGTWELLFNTEGVFFRTEGQGASAFGGGVQGDAIRNIVGGMYLTNNFGDLAIGTSSSTSGVFAPVATDTSPLSITTGGPIGSSTPWGLQIDASRMVPTATENRPRNLTIRVWRKTAH